MEILPIGSVVKLKNGQQKIMIISRVPLYNYNGKVGYFDYAGCLYPNGQNGQQTFFFNDDDIKDIFFKGYTDELEQRYLELYEREISKVKYPKLNIKEVNEKLL